MRATLDLLLQDWLGVADLLVRERFADHSLETVAPLLDLCERVAEQRFQPANRIADREPPIWIDGEVRLPQATHDAHRAYVETGLLAASQDFADGGQQLPCVIETAANAFFSRASVAVSGYAMLTRGNAGLLMAHGTPRQRAAFAAPQLQGRWLGTMCLSEPQAGSSLSDVLTRAVADGDDENGPRYRLHGSKMWISGGDHDLSENIVHLVLAKIPDEQGRLVSGPRGLSLFIVPKWLPADSGALGERNDIAVAGLNHKLGYRGTSNALLAFGDGSHQPGGRAGAIGWRVGAVGEGLRLMFHMMNEARIAVGLGAVMLGQAGYETSLAYARERLQGRPIGASGKDAASPPCALIAHADVRRMLLAQKAFVEGGLALALYCARLVDEQRTGEAAAARDATQLLELLTPMAKSWPSEWCLEANSLAIQVLGGYGYTQDFPVEQHWRDNRLNMIHEGTHGIQALDLLGRKVLQNGGAALELLGARVNACAEQASGQWPQQAQALRTAWQALRDATQAAWQDATPTEALANATPYLQAFGHVVVAWLWLDVARVASAVKGGRDADLCDGKIAAMAYYFAYELPKTPAWLAVVSTRNPVCREMRDAWF